MRAKSLIPRCLLLVIAAAAALSPRAGVAEEAAPVLPAAEREALGKSIDAALASLSAAQDAIPRETFEPGAIVGAVGRDPAKLLDWVRANTTAIPYRGALRGARGVLLDRMGNSLDRSLLLAELLRLSGRKLRLARVTLDPSAVPPLAGPAAKAPAAPAPAEGAADPELEKLALAVKARADEASRRVAEDGKDLLAAVAGKLAPGAGAAGPSAEESRDDWWVQAEIDGKWVDFSLRDGPVPRPAATFDVAAKDGAVRLPPADCHEVEVAVVIERWAGGRTRDVPVLRKTLRPSDVLGRPIALATYPTRLAAGTDPEGKDAIALMSAATEWTSVLTVGSSAVAIKGFSDTGDLVGKPSLGLEPAGGAMGGFGGMLGGGEGPSKSDAVLTAAWLDFTVRAPGREPRSFRREIFDLLGPAARATGIPKVAPDDAARLRRACALSTRIDVLALPCQPSEAFVKWQAAANLRANLTALRADLGKDVVDPRDVAARLLLAVGSMQGPLYDWALSRKEWNPRGGEVALTGLNLVDFRTGPAVGADGTLVGRTVFDVAVNEVAVPFAAPPAAAEVRLLQGVADTVAEGALASAWAEAQNTSQVAALAREGMVGWRLLSAGESPPESLDADTRARLARDLSAGFAALVPERAVDLGGRPRTGWWRIDLVTGSTIGVMDSGLNEAAEDVLMRQVLHWMLRLQRGGTLLSFARIAQMDLVQFLVYMGYRHGPGMRATYVALVALRESIQAVSNLPYFH